MSKAKGRKVRASEAERLLEEWEASGERMSAWCRARGLNWTSPSHCNERGGTIGNLRLGLSQPMGVGPPCPC